MISIDECEFFNSKDQIVHMATDIWQESSLKSKIHREIACQVHLSTGLQRVKNKPVWNRLYSVFTRIKDDPAYKMTLLHKLQFLGKCQFSH
jgi:hypothetical protein